MNPDGFDDVRLLLHDADPGPLPDLDVDRILRDGARQRRRTTRDRWLAAAAVVLVLAGAGAAVAQIGRPEAVSPSDPVTPSGSFAPTPFSPETWMLYSQSGIAQASSVHMVELLGPVAGGTTVDVVLSSAGADGTVTAQGVTSRYVAAGGVTYVEPAVLVKLGAIKAGDAGSATWVRLSPPDRSRFRLPSSIQDSVNTGDLYRFGAEYATARVVDGRPTTAVSIDASQMVEGAKRQTYFFETQAPYLPLLIERDGLELVRFTDWNAPVAPPVAPPASEVVDIPGL